ncbi:MAG: hypothetical protein WC644_12355 [Ignavibacteria bacterium]
MDIVFNQKPLPEEYPGHYTHYVDLVPEGNIIKTFEKQSAIAHEFLSNIPEELGDHTYAFGKWTIKDIVGHLSDTERIFSSRALRIARGRYTAITGF